VEITRFTVNEYCFIFRRLYPMIPTRRQYLEFLHDRRSMFVEVSYHKPGTAEHTAGRRHSRSSPSHSRTRSRHWNTRRTTSLQISAVHRTTVAVRDFIAQLTRTAFTRAHTSAKAADAAKVLLLNKSRVAYISCGVWLCPDL